MTLDIVLRELHTITDFTTYLSRKEALFRSGKVCMAAGEEELLAYYLTHTDKNKQHDFNIDDKFDLAYFDEGSWASVSSNPQYVAKKAADRQSYAWDEIIEKFSHNIVSGTLESGNDRPLSDHERGLRMLASESRLSRRNLAKALLSELSFWDAAIDLKSGEQKEIFPCPNCSANLKKRSIARAFVTAIDPLTQASTKLAKREVVYLSFENERGRGFKSPETDDIKLAHELETIPPKQWVPIREIPKGDRYYKDGLHLVGLDYFHRFYFSRTLHIIAFIWNEIDLLEVSTPIKNRLRFIVTSMLDRNLTIRNRGSSGNRVGESNGKCGLKPPWILGCRGFVRWLNWASCPDGQFIEATAAPVGHVHVPRFSPPTHGARCLR